MNRNIDEKALGKEWTLVEIKRLLRAIPPLVRDARQKAIKAEFALGQAQMEVKKQKALAQLQASKQKEAKGLSSAEDRKAWVQSRPEVVDAEVAEIDAKATQLICDSDHAYMENMFSAVRKVANLMEGEYNDQKRVERQYGDGQGQ